MIQNKKTRLILVYVLPIFFVLMVVTAWAETRADERVLRAFGDVVDGLAQPQQMHLVAEVLLAADGDDENGVAPWTTTARYAYWQDGDRFRVSARVAEPDTPLAGDFDVSWDGETFYLWLRQDDLLSLSTQPPGQLPVSLPHPLMLALASLSSNRDGAEEPPWVPASLKGDRWKSEVRLGPSSLTEIPRVARSLFESEPTVLRVELATGRAEGRELRDEMSMAQRDGHWVIEQIQRFDTGGSPVSELRFDRFRPADGDPPGHLYPRVIDLEVAAVPGGRSGLRSTFAVKELTVNGPIDPEVFDLTREEPTKI